MNDFDQRIQRLEEKHAFTERTAEELSAELARAYEQIDRLVRRMEALEKRLVAINEQGEGEEGT